MDTLFIINKDGLFLEHSVSEGVLTVGSSSHYDVELPFDRGVSISFIKKGESCTPQIVGDFSSSGGPWGNKMSQHSVLTVDDYTFVYLRGVQVKKAQVKDWDSSLFPRDFEQKKYPERLLNFLLHIIDADQGAILLLEGSSLKTVASEKVELQDQSELFLQRILESRKDEMVVNMSYNTHTLLFKAGLTPLDFCLIQYPVGKDEKIVLYLPKTKRMGGLPSGIMTTLLALCAGNLVNHLLFRKQSEFKRKTNDIEFDFFWGSSSRMLSLKNYVDKLCLTNLSLLIQGETGTGKEMLVKYIRKRSKQKKVVSVNCAAIPRELAESTLFGHKKGAFTGAHSDQIGKIQEADGGILFLDEIGELDLEVQAKLLRTIQENRVTPLGGQEQDVQFWLMSATHRNIEQMIEERAFREDLYFRINEAKIQLPSMAERSADIPFLAAHFVDEVVRVNGLERKALAPEVFEYLKNRKWKGNIRELKGFIRKIILLSESEVIDCAALEALGLFDKDLSHPLYPEDLQAAKRIFVESHIKKILDKCEGNKSQAARVMGITPRNLYRLLPDKRDKFDLPH